MFDVFGRDSHVFDVIGCDVIGLLDSHVCGMIIINDCKLGIDMQRSCVVIL